MRLMSAALTSSARELRKKLRKCVSSGLGQGQPFLVISLPDDDKMIAPVNRPHAVRIEIRALNKPSALG